MSESVRATAKIPRQTQTRAAVRVRDASTSSFPGCPFVFPFVAAQKAKETACPGRQGRRRTPLAEPSSPRAPHSLPLRNPEIRSFLGTGSHGFVCFPPNDMRGLLKVEIIKDGIVPAAQHCSTLVAMNPNRASLYFCLVSACVSRTNG